MADLFLRHMLDLCRGVRVRHFLAKLLLHGLATGFVLLHLGVYTADRITQGGAQSVDMGGDILEPLKLRLPVCFVFSALRLVFRLRLFL